MSKKRCTRRFIFYLGLFLALNNFAFAQEKKIEGNYFYIYYPTALNPLEITPKLEFFSSHLLQTGQHSLPEEVLAKVIDALFLEVSDILDIHLYSFKGKIKIFLDFQALNSEFYKLYQGSLKTPSFYVYDTNTIYISVDNLRAGILGHEIAHALINHYFVVPPPMKIQEVLAGYVEYTLNKNSK
ncbi:MAG: hypothetical protein NC920_05610 [Candidatus Omnitrophica bacterium]|nr:hypothetical protein [Candidatus Omnitrophota bacterium]MCM8798005.1 hypothetical protein [Candidatus Omnitrophota bacterium]